MWDKFTAAFITEDRWKLYLQGLGVTIEVAFFAAIIGLILGTILALMKLSKREDGKRSILNLIATIYVDIIRGTPSVLQLLIMWFIVLASTINHIINSCSTLGVPLMMSTYMVAIRLSMLLFPSSRLLSFIRASIVPRMSPIIAAKNATSIVTPNPWR